MKRTFLFYLFVFSSILLAQPQDKFIIGVDWANPGCPAYNYYGNFQPLSPEYWDTLKSLGVNTASLYIAMNQPNGIDKINAELLKADAEDISVFLWPIDVWDYFPDTEIPTRWMYQVEDDYDFGSHISGQSFRHAEAEPHWSQVKVDENAPNYWELRFGINQLGYIAEDVIDDDLQPDGTNYYVRLKLRKTSTTSTHTPILEVRIYNKTDPGYPNSDPIWNEAIYTDELNQNEWTEKYLPRHFSKLPQHLTIMLKEQITRCGLTL